MIDWGPVQTRLALVVDGKPGPVTYAALLSHIAGRPLLNGISAGFASHVPSFGVDQSPERLAAFLSQCCHESGGFRYAREIWGPTSWQLTYEGRADLGNAQPGDGERFRGGGWIEVTGRYWFERIGTKLGLPLADKPELVDQPEIATLVSLAWWDINGMNDIADSDDVMLVTKRINPGLLGLDDRKALYARAKSML